MPTKKKVEQVAGEIAEVQEAPIPVVEPVIEKVEAVAVKAEACGHINRQHTNTDGKLEGIACTLSSGHVGDHSATVEILRKQQYLQKDPELKYKFRDGQEYEVREEATFWSDAAGVPVDSVKPDYEGFANRKEWEDDRKRKRSNSQL